MRRVPRPRTASSVRPAKHPAGSPARPAAETAHDRAIEHLLFDHISDAVFATDAANRFTHWTKSAERLFGYSAEEAIGRPFEDVLPFEMMDEASQEAFFGELKAGRTWRGTGSVRLRDGSAMWLESTVQPILDEGRFTGSVSVARDITAAVQAQRRQAEQERFINTVLDVAGALVLVLDAEGLIVRFNGACERLTGFASADVVGRPFWDVVVLPGEADAVRRSFVELGSAGFPGSTESYWMTRSGEIRLIAWENTRLADASGTVSHLIATGIDVTEARRGDDALRGVETVGRLLAERGPDAATLDAVLGELEERMGYGFLSVYLRDGAGLRLGAQRGYAAMPSHLDAGSGVIGRVYRTGVAALVTDVGTDPDYHAGTPDIVAEIAVPLLGGDGPLGVLNIESPQVGRLTQADLRLAGAVADRLSTALLLNREQEALRDRTRLFAALAEFSGVANAILDPRRLAKALVEAVGAVVSSDTIVITTRDRADGTYRVEAVRGISENAVGAIIEPGDGNTGTAIAERRVVMSDHHPRGRYASALRAHVRSDTMSGIAVPLIHEGAVVGVISVGRTGVDATFSNAEREVIALLGSQAALALVNANLVDEVSALAIHDGLTGLYNRRHFDAALDLAIARFKRRAPAGNLSAIMFDLDHFGNFNRLHGHLAGDAMLRLFAGVLRERLRSADLVARYGGEEFIVILEDTSLADVLRVADEIRRELAARPVSGADGDLHATVSAGCAEVDRAGPTREDLIGRADTGLFRAKRAGRNRVVAA